MNDEFANLDEEVMELLQNYKHKKVTTYEPCSLKNVKECLIGLNEEFGLLNINYIFNPYIDFENNTLCPEGLVHLINCVWTLLHYYKNTSEKADRLAEQNHTFEHNNKQLNSSICRLKEKLTFEKNEAKACVASAQRISDRSDEVLQSLVETRARLARVTKQKEGAEKTLRNEVTRLKKENDKLRDRIRNQSGSRVSCSDVCDLTLQQLKERDRKHRAVISQLQNNNQELIQEILALKEEIILGGLHDFHIDQEKKK